MRWIISDEELKAFKQLSSDQERDQFIEAFWRRRDPTPDTMENEYREQHYRRIVFANEQFGSFIPGWRTHRGRLYIMYGPPEDIETHASGGTYTPSGGPTISNLPYEVWHYRFIEGLGKDVAFSFADICKCGDYELSGGESHYVAGNLLSVNRDRNLGWPRVRFKDLEEVVSHKVDIRLVPFTVRTDFVRATDFTVIVPVTIRVRGEDIAFVKRDEGADRGTLNVFGRITSTSGWAVETFEDTLQADVMRDGQPKEEQKAVVYQNAVLLRPGQYCLYIAVRDVNGDRIGTSRLDIQVPEYQEGEMSTSTLVLADKMGPASTENVPGTGRFVAGATYVRPLVAPSPDKPISIGKGQNVNVWMQAYDLAVDQRTNRPSATVDYDVVSVANGKSAIHMTESSDQTGNTGGQMTVKKTLAAANLQPGTYKLRVTVRDHISRQALERSTTFTVQ